MEPAKESKYMEVLLAIAQAFSRLDVETITSNNESDINREGRRRKLNGINATNIICPICRTAHSFGDISKRITCGCGYYFDYQTMKWKPDQANDKRNTKTKRAK